MTWVRLDDSFPDHPKVVVVLDNVGPAGMWLHVTALCWCAKHLTDGKIPEAQVSALVAGVDSVAVAEVLVDAKLWKRTRTGFTIHDFLKYHPSAKAVKEQRKLAASRQKKWRESRVDNAVTNAELTDNTTVSLAPGRDRAGSGRVNEGVEAFQGTAELDASVFDAVGILEGVWGPLNSDGIERVAAMFPGEDLAAGARLAVVWGSSPDWKLPPAATLAKTMEKLHDSAAGGRSKSERGSDRLAGLRALQEDAV